MCTAKKGKKKMVIELHEEGRRKKYIKPNSIDKSYQYTQTVANTVTGDTIILPPMTNQRNITITIIAGAGIYMFTAWILRCQEINWVLQMLARKGVKPADEI